MLKTKRKKKKKITSVPPGLSQFGVTIQYSPSIQRHDAYNAFAELGHSILENQRIRRFRQILKIPQELRASQTPSLQQKEENSSLCKLLLTHSPSMIRLADSKYMKIAFFTIFTVLSSVESQTALATVEELSTA